MFPRKAPWNRFPNKGSKNRFPGTGSQEQVSKNRFPSKVTKEGFSSKAPRNRFASKVSRHRVPSKVYFVPMMTHYSSFVWGHCCVFKRAHLKTERKRAANNFLNCRTDRIDNQRLTPALKHDCDKYVVTFSFGCCC